MKSGFYVAGLFASGILLLAACGSGADEFDDADDMDTFVEESSTDPSDFPADFPRELIPLRYTTSHYTDMKHINGLEGAAFGSSEPVQHAIQHYVELLGDPTINVDSEEGERNVQWHKTPWPPWIVAVMGNDSETMVSVSKIPEQ